MFMCFVVTKLELVDRKVLEGTKDLRKINRMKT